MGLGQRLRRPGKDRVHRARADASAKQLFDELDGVLAGDPVAHRQRRHGCFKPRAEGAAGRLVGQRGACAPAALGATQALALVLGHPDGDRRQLFELVARRLADRDLLARAEDVAAAAAFRPVLDDLIDRPRRQQRTPVALVAILSAAFAPRRILATQRRRERIGARRSGGVPRGAVQLALKLSDLLVLARHALLKPPDLLVHPKEDGHHNLAALIVDRLRLRPLHT